MLTHIKLLISGKDSQRSIDSFKRQIAAIKDDFHSLESKVKAGTISTEEAINIIECDEHALKGLRRMISNSNIDSNTKDILLYQIRLIEQ